MNSHARLGFLTLAILGWCFVCGLTLPQSSSRAWSIEGKGALADLYTAEKLYFAKTNRYTADIRQLEGFPRDKNFSRYIIGFSSQCPVEGETPGVLTTYTPELPPTRLSNDAIEKIMAEFGRLSCEPGFPNHFAAYAIGDLREGSLDLWRLDDSKTMTHVRDGSQTSNPLKTWIRSLLLIFSYAALWAALLKIPPKTFGRSLTFILLALAASGFATLRF